MSDDHHDHESFHMPSNTIAPLILGLGMTLTAVGIVNTAMLVVGLIVLFVGIGMFAFGSYD